MDVIVRLEERSLQVDAEFAATQRDQQALLRELITGVNRIADVLERQGPPTVPTQRSARTEVGTGPDGSPRYRLTER